MRFSGVGHASHGSSVPLQGDWSHWQVKRLDCWLAAIVADLRTLSADACDMHGEFSQRTRSVTSKMLATEYVLLSNTLMMASSLWSRQSARRQAFHSNRDSTAPQKSRPV